MLLADLRVDKVWTQAFRSSRVDAALVARQFAGIREAAEAELRDEGFVGVPEVHFSISMRYAGQNYEHQVPVPAETMTDTVLRNAFSSFETIHAERYGYAIEGEEIELVAFHVTVTGRRSAPRLVVRDESGSGNEPASRLVHFRGKGTPGDWGLGHVPTAIYRRYDVRPGTRLVGPCILEEPGSTTLVEPGMSVEVLPDGQLLIEIGVA
jgi:N-methylhydantoinase A